MFLEILITEGQRTGTIRPLRVVKKIPELDTPEKVTIHDFGGRPHHFDMEYLWHGAAVNTGLILDEELRRVISKNDFVGAELRLIPPPEGRGKPSIHAFIPLSRINAVALWRQVWYVSGVEERPEQAVWYWTSASPREFANSCYKEVDDRMEQDNRRFDPSKRAVLPRLRETTPIHRAITVTVDRWELLHWSDRNNRMWEFQEHHNTDVGVFSFLCGDTHISAERKIMRWQYRKLEDWGDDLPKAIYYVS